MKMLCTVLLLVVTASAATPTKKPASAPRQLVRFDASRTKLPTRFVGAPIVTAFEKFKTSRGEFEKTADYESRIAGLPYGTYAFVTPPLNSEYHADREELAVSLESRSVPTSEEGKASPMPAIEILREVKGSGSYVGENAFGAKRNIVKAVVTEYLLADVGDLVLKTDAPIPLNAPAPVARRIKPNIRAAVIANITPASARLSGIDIRQTKPTIHDPVDFTYFDHYLSAEVTSIWLFDFATGEVLLKWDITVTGSENRDTNGSPAVWARLKLREGMTKDEAKAVLGEPDIKETGNYDGMNAEKWVYRKGLCVLCFRASNSNLARAKVIRQSELPPLP